VSDNEHPNKRKAQAIARYMVISAYLALAPPRGERRALLEQLAKRTWEDAESKPMVVSAETIRAWIRRYRTGGLDALEDKARPKRGSVALTEEQVQLACDLKREVPQRSLDRLIRMMEQMKLIESGKVRRSTLHRALQREGLSARACRVPDATDLDRFEADAPNDMWQSDMLVGPWLPDPKRPGKNRRAYLYAFLDDHSRLLLHGRFSYKGDQPALELVFRRCLQKYGVPNRVYYDNGATYRARHMKQVVAETGIHGMVFTQRGRPMGHGKIEALNQYIRAAFLAELQASSITTLDELNEAFLAWSDYEYNHKVHDETQQKPRDRWNAGLDKVRYAEEETLRRAFLWSERRTTDKAAIFPLFGIRYQVNAELARKRLEVRYDPEQLDEVEVYYQGEFVERVQPFEVQAERRPQAPKQKAEPLSSTRADWLGHLVDRRRQEGFTEPTPKQLQDAATEKRAEQDAAVIDLLADKLSAAVFAEAQVKRFLYRYGPWDPERVGVILERLLETHPTDLHVEVYLDAIRTQLRGEP